MRIKLLATGQTREEKDSYAMRLIEQGKAVPVPQPGEKPKKEQTHGT